MSSGAECAWPGFIDKYCQEIRKLFGHAPTLRVAADCLPQGGTPPPARLFFTAPWVSSVLSLSISATSATLICTIVFGIVFFSSLNTDMRNYVADSVLLNSFGVILEGLEPSWAALGVS